MVLTIAFTFLIQFGNFLKHRELIYNIFNKSSV